MSATVLRKLTLKSTLKFGKYKDCTVEKLIGMKKQVSLTSIYFNLSNVTFTDDILDALGISSEWRIDKPSKNNDLYKRFLELNYGDKPRESQALKKMKVQTKSYKRAYLQSVNQGH